LLSHLCRCYCAASQSLRDTKSIDLEEIRMNCLVLFEILPMRFLFQKHQSCQSRLTMKVSLLLGGVGQDLGFKVGPCVLMEDG